MPALCCLLPSGRSTLLPGSFKVWRNPVLRHGWEGARRAGRAAPRGSHSGKGCGQYPGLSGGSRGAAVWMLAPRYISSQPLWMPAYGWWPGPLSLLHWAWLARWVLWDPLLTLGKQTAMVPWARCRISPHCAAAGGSVSPCAALGLSEIPWCLG